MKTTELLSNKAILLTAMGIGFVSPSALAQTQSVKRPNVLFIALDDLKPNIGIYGDTYAQTPNIDRLAHDGCTFMCNYCQMTLSGPTRASLMTGLRPDHEGVYNLATTFRKVNPSAVTIGEQFKSNGYATIGVGKIFHPVKGKKYRNDPKSWSEPYIATSASTYALANGRVSTECLDVPDIMYEDGIIAREAVKKIAELKNYDKPWFFGVGFHKPHMPWVAPKKYWDMYDREKAPLAEFQQMSSDPVYYAYHNSWEVKYYNDILPFFNYVDSKHLDTETQKRLIHGYYACVSYADAQIGKILKALDDAGLRENTIVVLWGDHGYHLGDHGLWNKCTNFENSTRTPMIFSVPGLKHDVKYNHVSEFVDIFPTLCELCGIDQPSGLDGVSLVPALKNQKKKVKDYAVSQYHRETIQGYAIRDERYRFVEWYDSFRTFVKFTNQKTVGCELYDYKTDPMETKNLAGDPRYASVVKRFRERLYAFYNEQYNSPHAQAVASKYKKKWH